MTVGNAKEVIQQLLKVRQVRQYQPDKVSDDDLNQLLEVARWTGSSRNTQPWHFVVVDDRDQLKQISELRTPINWVADAQLGIAIVLNGESDISEAYDEGRVTERIMIAAHLLGLGGGVAWYGDENLQSRAKEILGIPDERTARSIVAIGKPKSVKDPRPGPAEPGRRPIEELVSYNRMGNRSR